MATTIELEKAIKSMSELGVCMSNFYFSEVIHNSIANEEIGKVYLRIMKEFIERAKNES